MKGFRNIRRVVRWRHCQLPLAAIVSFGALALPGCGGDGDGSTSGTAPASGTGASAPKIAVQPMTAVDPTAMTGYFSDPYPIHTLAPSSTSSVPSFAGTMKKLLSCAGTVQPDCFTSTANTIDPGALASQAAAVNTTIQSFENLNSYQDSSGNWQMAVTAQIVNAAGDTWHVILHARPASTSTSGIPSAWVADALLVGSLGESAPANYDGKYFEDGGTLYLVYSRKFDSTTAADGIVAQAMQSATQPASSTPVPLLFPETANGGYDSELFDGPGQTSTFRLIETGNIGRIQGKYVMTYSTGGYNRPDYKSGVAWSDSFLPTGGANYTRVQKLDTAGVWGQPNHAEVQYLLQSQEAQWPNYVADQVLSPGVPSIVQDTGGQYFLFFAGYAPGDAPILSTGFYDGAHRRPFYVKLNVQIPAGATVSGTSPQALANWIQPLTGP